MEEPETTPEGAKVAHVNGRKLLLRRENFEKSYEEDNEAYFERIYRDFNHREAQATIHDIDYADVEYWPYEWLLKVGTEYYFRYEGTQIVPPCWETVHWRVMKDPIRVHQRQIDELNRLLAWRLSPDGDNECEVDTAGRLASDGDHVDMNRDVQYLGSLRKLLPFVIARLYKPTFPFASSLNHLLPQTSRPFAYFFCLFLLCADRMVFCQCNDWPSKFPADAEWCKNWKTDSGYQRLYGDPYSFDSNGEW